VSHKSDSQSTEASTDSPPRPSFITALKLPMASIRANARKVICIGRNYAYTFHFYSPNIMPSRLTDILSIQGTI